MRQKFKAWYSGLSKVSKVFLWSFGIFIVLVSIGSAQSEPQDKNIAVQKAAITNDAPKQPTTTSKEEQTTEIIGFAKQTRETADIPKGQSKIAQVGQEGIRTLVYKVTYTDGKETARELVSQVITKQPISEITETGTYIAPAPAPKQANSSCDSNYSGCVPIASDVDCASGSGNGPAYVDGPIRVLGTDIYDLDRDGDGVACSS